MLVSMRKTRRKKRKTRQNTVFRPRPLAATALAALVLAALLATWVQRHHPLPAGRPVPDFAAPGLGRADLPPGTILVNFFASWCIPCEAEHPALTALAAEIPVYGIAYMDEEPAVTAFLKRLGNPFRQTGIDKTGDAGAAWGVAGLPTSFLVRDGKILYRLEGPLTGEIVAQRIRPLLPAAP